MLFFLLFLITFLFPLSTRTQDHAPVANSLDPEGNQVIVVLKLKE